ncbi:MAG: alpha/beta hydrolase [Novosphingobium sp.]|nr:alpha/beta hydrolase [Novosphingobium sp.]
MPPQEQDFTNRYWTSPDGLELHYREYPGRDDRPPVVCIPGLTRNARDFEQLAQRLAGDWRVLCVELRGRGDSEYAKSWESYNPGMYLGDLQALFQQAGISRFVAVGTSLGGIMTMLLAATDPSRIAGAVLNDIGPVIEPEGLARIGDYVGQGRSFPTWMHAARATAETHRHAFPDYVIADWLAMAKRLMTLGGSGRIVFDYDMKIGEVFSQPQTGPAPDMWKQFKALDGKPLLAVRGALSDILSSGTLEAMQNTMPQMESVVVPRVGHAPTLDEPEAVEAILRLLGRVA